jgi:hypothetical protein
MIKKILILTGIIKVSIIAMNSLRVMSNTDGSPSGQTGSPSDNSSCASSCHKGPAKATPGMIKSTIPATGYVGGQTYSITVTVTGAATSKKFGFEASPQNAAGKLMGKLILKNVLETKLVGSGKYITHKTAGVTGTGSKSWTFDWQAPVKGSGALTFYGAFLVGGKPETVYTSSLAVKESK